MLHMSHLPREEGQGLVQYALILVLVAIVVTVIVALLGPAVAEKFEASPRVDVGDDDASRMVEGVRGSLSTDCASSLGLASQITTKSGEESLGYLETLYDNGVCPLSHPKWMVQWEKAVEEAGFPEGYSLADWKAR